jgi:hypothetical protein
LKLELDVLKERIRFKMNEEPIALSKENSKNYRKSWHWWDWLESWWHRFFWNWFSEIPRNIKYFFQRGIRGWSDCDLWGMQSFLTETILNMLVELRRIKSGYPATLDEKGKYSYDEQRWNKILDEMIEGFTILRKSDTYDEMIEYAPDFPDSDRIEMEKSMKEKYPSWRFTTREEEEKVKRAFELMFKYYHSLWD